MLRSYFTVTLRNILRSKGYSFITIAGLSLGIACCLLMFSYVFYEFSFDNFHPNAGRTYRVDQVVPWSLDSRPSGSTAPPLANVMRTTYPEVEDALRINTPGDFIIRYADGKNQTLAFQENHVYAADTSFFNFFGFTLKEGNPRTALSGVNKVVISEETAAKLFGEAPALGKLLQLGDDRTAIEVTGVTAHQPENSHFHFDYLLSMDTNPNIKRRDWSWVWTQVATYVRLREDADPRALEEKMKGLGENVIKPAFAARGMDYANAIKTRGSWDFHLTAMQDIYLKSGDSRLGPVGDITYAYTFGITGLFVLIIAAINFINLSTARGTKRAKEVGVKKALGAARGSLISQFQTESIFLATFSTIFALALMEGLRLAIKETVAIDIPFPFWQDVRWIILLPFVPLVIGFAAGLYPAFYLTSFRPVQVLKGKLAAGPGNLGLRNGLVVIQFAISIALIAGTIVVFDQLQFMRSKNLGFERENVLLINYGEKLGNHLETFRQELETFPGVTQAALTTEVPGGNTWSDDLARENADVHVNIAIVKTDDQYFNTLGFKLVAGRAFEKERIADANAVILNETSAQLFGWTPEKAVGQYLVYPGNDNSRHEIIGVMKDFHYESLRSAIPPVMFTTVNSVIWGDQRVIAVKFKTNDLPLLLLNIEKKWNSLLDDTPFSFSFLDQDLALQYQTEERMGGLFAIFSALSIFIAIIGLVGLVSYSAEMRKKEIGIRKVFGASTSRIVIMINSQYVRLIALALAVAIPLSWWAMAQWLQSFAYHIEINSLTFLLAGTIELTLALLSVGYLSLQAAWLNPARVLRDE